jgi:periplasmic protein TonB
MSYQALLFCPDEKTARVVSQVLSEVDFHVEPCHEPFAAVKKLMGQHFDAIVVDCDNEQNAALLFKSAHNSGSNQASLAVAVVEGQAGVAKAFRLGANLVLTKPIHVEQSKGTLRVARGLLRKGQAAKPAGAVSTSAEPVAGPQSSFSLPSVSAPPVSAPSLSAPFPAHAVTPPPVSSASAFELDAEPEPQPDTVDAALLEYMPDNAPSSAQNSQQSAIDSTSSKQYAWQPRSKPMAEPMASALRRAAEVAGKSEFDNPPATHAGVAPQAKGGAAAAPARSKEAALPSAAAIESKSAGAATPARSKLASGKNQEPVVAEAWGTNSAIEAPEAPSFASLGSQDHQASDAGGSKKTQLVAIVLLGAAAAGYFGWTKMQSGHPQPLPQSIAPASPGTASLPPNPAPSATESQPSADEVMAPQPAQISNPPSSTNTSKPSAAVVADVPGVKPPVPAKAATGETDATGVKAPTTVKVEQAQPLVVKNGPSTQPKTEIAVQEPEQAPPVTSIATNTDSSALTGLVNTSAVNATTAAQHTLRISQGVSQGLILKKVSPVYPAQARQMRLEGKVELQANISKTGSIASVKQLSGDAILGRAAIEAVRQWKYKPYYLSGEPVEVETQITVNFKLP